MHKKYCGRPKNTFTCKTCEKEKPINYHSTNQYCSTKCAQIASRAERTEEWYKRKRAVANEAWARYEARKRNQTPPDADIKVIQEIYKNCPEGYEVDHIIPISKGGLHHQDNLQYLTAEENRKKGNKILK
jgi:5-methylcytosine-specific restriction endonuclease McrA